MTTEEKRIPDVDKTIDNGTLTITVRGFAPIVVRPDDYPTELVNHAALHGFAQKYGDAAALSKGATLAEKHASILLVVGHHRETGEWNRKGGASGDGTSGDGLLVAAIAEFDGCTRDEARALVGAMDKKTQAAMRSSDALRPIIERIKTERAKPAPKVDVAAILARMKG